MVSKEEDDQVPMAFSGKTLQIINELVSIPSPSGYTDRIISHMANHLDNGIKAGGTVKAH